MSLGIFSNFFSIWTLASKENHFLLRSRQQPQPPLGRAYFFYSFTFNSGSLNLKAEAAVTKRPLSAPAKKRFKQTRRRATSSRLPGCAGRGGSAWGSLSVFLQMMPIKMTWTHTCTKILGIFELYQLVQPAQPVVLLQTVAAVEKLFSPMIHPSTVRRSGLLHCWFSLSVTTCYALS